MLNKSNSEKSTCKYFNKSQNSSSNLISNSNSQKKSSSSKIKKSKLNTILNRTLSDSVLNKKSTYFSNPWHHHKKQTCLSRKNSTNRRSLIYNPNSTLFNQNFLYSNNSSNRISFYTSASAGPQSPSVFSNQSPVPNIFSNQNSIHNINQYNNLRNKLKQHRSSCCVVNNTSNNLSQQLDPYENNNFSLSSSICSSLSPSPITLVNRQNSLVLSTPPSNINLNFPTSSKNSQPVSSPLSLTPASALEQRKSINNVKQSSILVSSKSKRDSRRWSLASMHSSDCNPGMNTPKMISSLPPSFQQQSSSAVPSQYSSSTYLNDNIISNKKILQNQKCYSDQSNIPLNTKNSSDNLKHCKSEENQIEYSQRLSFGGRRRRLSSSNESSHLDDSSDVGFSSPLPFHRQRARSLSCSPCKGLNDSDIAPTEKFKEKFPKACKQLEENLQLFIDLNKIDLNTSTCSMGSNENQNNSSNSKNSKYYVSQPSSLDPAARFIQNQVIEIAKLCLEKSKSNQLTCSYLDEMTSSLEKLLLEARDKCCQVELSVEYLHKFIKKFLFIISHVARLLECIEFDPLEFSHFLDCAEQQAKQQEIKTDIPKYIISKLGIDRDPIKELNNEEEVIHSLNRTNSLTSRTSTSGFSGDDFLPSDFSLTTNGSLKSDSNAHVVPPSQDDFEEVKIISNGAYGAVYLVRHKMLGHRFAMKKIKKQNLILRNQIQQVFTERDIMTFTDNPFVVALICTFETKKHLCMVMEYVEGGDVATLIKNMGPLPLDMARTYFAEATLAVEYLHNYGIIHRDLKPDNLLITSLGHIKLTDFGLSKIGLMNLTTNFFEDDNFMKDLYCKEFNDKQICGTPQYLAPEVILRQSYGKTVDWWSMGIILYEFFTSIAPFNGNTPEDLFSNVINGEICWPDDEDEIIQIPEDAKNLILGLLTHDPIKRLGANGAIEIKQHPFFNFLDWNNLLRIKAEFIPQLDGPDDTSYFDTRSERYNHDSDSMCTSLPNNSCFTLPNTEPVSKAESCLSLNNQNEDKILTELLNKNLTLNQNEDTLNSDLLNDDTDNELFASFSSCSSKFRLSSISNNNSPVLFMNESNSGSRMNIDSDSNQSPMMVQNENSKLAKNLIINLENVKNDENPKNENSKLKCSSTSCVFKDDKNEISKIKDSSSSSSSTSTTTTTKSVLDINKNSTFNQDDFNSGLNSSSSVINLEDNSDNKSDRSTPLKSTPTTPTSTNKFKNGSNNSNVRNSSQQQQQQQTWSKSKNVNYQQGSRKMRNQQFHDNRNGQYQVNNNNNKNRWSSSITSNNSLSTSPTINSQNNLLNTTHLNKSNQHLISNNSFKRPSFDPTRQNSSSNPRLNHLSVPNSSIFSPYQNKNQYNQYQCNPSHYNENIPLNEMIRQGLKNPKIIIKRSSRGYGFVIRAIKVFYGDSDLYTIQHLVVQIDQQGPAFSAGLKVNDIITHVNDEIACGKMHHEIVKLIMSSVNNTLYLNTIQLDQANIKTGGRKRSPSKTKFARPYSHQQQLYQQYFNHYNHQNKQFNNSKQRFNHQNSVQQESLNLPLSAYILSSNPSTTNSSTSSLISSSSRRSFGGCVSDVNSYPLYNPSLLQTTHQNFAPNYHNPHIFHNMPHQMQTLLPPSQPVQHDRKKKACLLRKLSEKYANAHKHELQQQFQLQHQQSQTHPHSSSSSSSSSSLNNSFNNNLRNICGNLSPRLHPTHFNNNLMIDSMSDAGNITRRNMSTSDLHLSMPNQPSYFNYPFNMSNSNSPSNSFPNSPSHSQSPINFIPMNTSPLAMNNFHHPIQRNRPHSMIVLDNNSKFESDQEFSNFKKNNILSSNINTTRGSNTSNFIDDLNYIDNDSTITAGNYHNSNPSIVSGNQLNENIFNPNHHFQSINPPAEQKSQEKCEKSEPLFSEVVSKGLEVKNEESDGKKNQGQKNSKPSLISSIKSSFISKTNSNSKLNLSPFSNIKNFQSGKNSQKMDKQQKKQDKQKPKEKQSQVHNPSPLATSDGLVITYGKLTSVQTSLVATTSTSQLSNSQDTASENNSTSSFNSVIEKQN